MIKAKGFLDYLCKVLDYRFFSGIPCVGSKVLYSKMRPDFMHYVPATTPEAAVGMVTGACLGGVNGAILLDSALFIDIIPYLTRFNIKYKQPVLIILFGVEETIYKKCKDLGITVFELNEDYKNTMSIIAEGLENTLTTVLFIDNWFLT